MGDSWLSPQFLGELDGPVREAFAALDESVLEVLLQSTYDAARAQWPAIDVDASVYIRHLAASLDGAEPDTSLASVQTTDLYLACACAHGDPTAIGTLEREFVSTLDAALRSTGLDAHAADDVKQTVREHMLVGKDGVPGISNYRGRGKLRSWMRAVSLRQAMMHMRGKRETPVGDEALAGLPAIANDAELAPWKDEYAAAFRSAFEAAITEDLDENERNLLRQHHLDRLSIDALASLYRVHRATAARWVAAARDKLHAGVRKRITAQLAIASDELDSALRLARSRFDVSIHRLLGGGRT